MSDYEPCPLCRGETVPHCRDEQCELLRCTDCHYSGLEGGGTWLPPRKWDRAWG